MAALLLLQVRVECTLLAASGQRRLLLEVLRKVLLLLCWQQLLCLQRLLVLRMHWLLVWLRGCQPLLQLLCIELSSCQD
jgi:hypothetical protein